MVPKEFLTTLARRLGVSDNELEVLSRAIQGESMSSISQQLGVRVEALQKRLGEVYKKFHITGAGPGKLAKLQQILITEYQKQAVQWSQEPDISDRPASTPAMAAYSQIDWGEAPDLPIFYGRNQEISTLQQWILQDRCRLITLLGMGGIGKTALIVRTIQRIQSQFDRIIWRSVRYAPSLGELIGDLLEFLSPGSSQALPNDSGRQLKQLLTVLRNSRCLLVIDNFEALLEEQVLAGNFRPGYEDYAELLHQVGELQHASCLLLLSREKPREIAALAGEHLPVRSLQISQLDFDSSKRILLSTQRLNYSSDSQLEEVAKLYGGNPTLLKVVSTSLRELYDGQVDQYLQYKTVLVGDIIKNLLDGQFKRLSGEEKDLIYWLALLDRPVSAHELQQEMAETGDVVQLMMRLESLLRRSMIGKTSDNGLTQFTLLPVLRQYAMSQYQRQMEQQLKQDRSSQEHPDFPNLDSCPSDQKAARYLNFLGHQKYLVGEFQSAKFYLQWAVRFYPSLSAAHYNLGATFEQLEALDSARYHYQQATSGQNRAAQAAVSNLSRLEILAGRIEQAIHLIMPILEQVEDPTVKAGLYKNLGWASFLQRRYRDADSQLQRSLELNPHYAPTHCLLAQVIEAEGDPQAALSHWEQGWQLSNTEQLPQGGWKLPELEAWKVTAAQRLNFPDA